jgi:hypothetical protein
MNGNLLPIVEPRAQIPAQSAQRAGGPRDPVLSSTGELHEFGEQPHRFSDSTHPQQRASQSIEWPPYHHQDYNQAQNSSTITGNNTSHLWGGLQAETMANQSWLQHQGERAVDTTNYQGNSPNSAKQRTEEEMNQERAFGSEADTSHQHRSTNPQHHTSASGISLANFPHHTPQLPAHSATAAEIALGIASPFHSREDNIMHQQAMAHDSRVHRLRTQNHETTNKPADISSVIESLSEVKDRDEDNTSRTSETGLVTSTGRITPLNDSSDHFTSDNPRSSMGMGTPSTVSTAPSTDDASLGADYRLDDSHLPNLLQGFPGHARSNSWGDEGLLPGASGDPYLPQLQEGQWMQGPPSSSLAAQNQWGSPDLSGLQQPQHRIASFRQNGQNQEEGGARSHDPVWPPQHTPHFAQQLQPRHYAHEQSGPYGSHGGQQPSHPEMRQPSPHHSQQYGGYQQVAARKSGPPHGAVPLAAGTPPRPRNPRQPGQAPHRQQPQGGLAGSLAGSPHQSGANNQRSSSEILKTLLRKKACLYEPDTSRSVALVTWLVGRELALEHGFFSRQQLQSGVHACVSDKIDSGIITRTKVNRCMQIILNSCFHYIIPRSDGTEEKGDVFRIAFLQTVKEDSFLLQHLPVPWNNLEVHRESILLASMAEEEEKMHHTPTKNASTPKTSPRITSVNAPNSPGRDLKDSEDGDSKRAVLLCFNENVRSAEDVIRCHNEFIRDTANAAHLQLTAHEWRSFFGHEAARAPYLWGNIGIPIPSSEAKTGASRHNDALGQMSEGEACKFRTTWCAKRYDHDHNLCGFAHIEVNGGWLRRNPAVHRYQDQSCPDISSASEQRVSSSHFFVNQCPKGVHCDKAHSMEEIIYHPRRYKTKNCTAALSRSGWCELGDVCPNVHPAEASKPSKKHGDGRSHGPRHPKKNEQNSAGGSKPGHALPPGSPMIYASPAPVSSFERHLGMPGLQNLFRRHSSVVRAHVQNPGECMCVYNCFGDDLGTSDGASQVPKACSGLPTPGAS